RCRARDAWVTSRASDGGGRRGGCYPERAMSAPPDPRRARVRAAWTPPPGPLPAGDRGDPDLRPHDGESLDALAGEWRIFQRADGHRYSTDDLLTAWYAAHHAAQRGLDVRRYVDL